MTPSIGRITSFLDRHSPGHVVDGGPVVAQAADCHHAQGQVGLSVAAAVQAHVVGLARGNGDRSCTTDPRERGPGVQSVEVLPGGDQETGGVDSADAEP